MKHGSEEWHAARRGKITSSTVAGVLGLNDRMTPLQAWAQITGRERFDGNKATERGNLLESLVLDYPTIGDDLIRIAAPYVGRDWTGDSADCLYRGDDLFVGEGKTVGQGLTGEWGEEGTDEVPDHVVIQSLWHLHHWPEASACIVPALFGGYAFEFRQYVVHRDDDLIADIVERCERWHRDYVVADKPPPASAGDDDSLRHIWPKHVPDRWLDPTDELAALVRQYIDARDAAKAAEAEKKASGARLRQLLGDAEGCRGPGFKVTHKHQSGAATTDWEAIALELGAQQHHIEKHTRMGAGHRVLRATLPKKG